MWIRASRRRRALLVVVAGVVIAALLPVLPASAASEACPTSIPKSSFGDLRGMTGETVEAINCIAYYGITQGTGPTTFSPNVSVPRWQMALFLIRMAQDLGIALPSGATQGFTDIGALNSATQTAINQLRQLGITQGTSPSTFSPALLVPRWQMALFLTRLYARAGFVLPNAFPQGFVDIAGHDPATQQAINQLVQLGIAKGTSTTTFNPSGDVSRWQMALFLARELDAGRASPYTVSLVLSTSAATVSETVSATITVKDRAGKPVAGRVVDVFVGTFNSNGTCALDANAKVGGGNAGTGTDCTIDGNDPKTNSQGVATTSISHAAVLETDTVVAWIGESGETFDADEVRTKTTALLTWAPAPTALTLEDVTVRYGTTATVAATFRDGSARAVPLAGQRVVFTVSRDGVPVLKQTVLSDTTGKASFSYVGPADPSSGSDPAEIDTVKAFWDKDGDGIDDGAAELDGTATVTWDDDDPRNDVVVLAQASASSLVGVQAPITLTVTDKWGVGYAHAEVTFKVTGPNEVTIVATTNAGGVATMAFAGTTSGVDDIDARVDLNGDGSIDPEDFSFGEVPNLTHFSVQVAPSLTDGPHSFDLLGVDTARNTIDVEEIGSGSLYRLVYDSTNDLFSVNGAAQTLAQFEAVLTALEGSLPVRDGTGGTELVTNTYTAGAAGSSTFILETS